MLARFLPGIQVDLAAPTNSPDEQRQEVPCAHWYDVEQMSESRNSKHRQESPSSALRRLILIDYKLFAIFVEGKQHIAGFRVVGERPREGQR